MCFLKKKYGVGKSLGVTSFPGFGDVFRYGLGYDMTLISVHFC